MGCQLLAGNLKVTVGLHDSGREVRLRLLTRVLKLLLNETIGSIISLWLAELFRFGDILYKAPIIDYD